MPHRIEQVNELIKEELGKIFLKEVDQVPGVLITLTHVETSEDRSSAEVFVSVYPQDAGERVMQELRGRAGWLQRLLIKQLTMHPMPRISFVYDSSPAEADRIEQLVEHAKKSEDENQNDGAVK